MAIAALVVIGVGVPLILGGLYVSLSEHRRQHGHRGVEARPLGLSETLDSLQRLVVALAQHPVGIRLIVLGIVCILIGGFLGGISSITC